jgi:two-component system, NtrC family, sensor histidine kinase HydH
VINLEPYLHDTFITTQEVINPMPLTLNQVYEIVALLVVVILVALLHYATTSNGQLLLHEISQRLYYLPIVYAAYRFGIKGAVGLALLSGTMHLLHIAEHATAPAASILNQYAEVLMFQIVGVSTGLLATAEQQQRRRAEQTSVELATAYHKLQETVGLLTRAAKLQSVGEMAAAITHEVRNPLGAIKGAIEILEEEIAPTSPRYQFVDLIQREVERLNNLVSNFLRFAKPQPTEKFPTNLNAAIQAVVNLADTQTKKTNIQIITALDPNLRPVMIDVEQCKQVLLNLVLNAIQAMPQGGQVTITSRQLPTTIEISIADQGTGIDPSHQARIFDPFFTTKPTGSGLGLAIAEQLINQNQGSIRLASSNSQGSCFVIQLATNN